MRTSATRCLWGISRKGGNFKKTLKRFNVFKGRGWEQRDCRQGRSVIEFFEQAMKAMVNPDMQAPSLIPSL